MTDLFRRRSIRASARKVSQCGHCLWPMLQSCLRKKPTEPLDVSFSGRSRNRSVQQALGKACVVNEVALGWKSCHLHSFEIVLEVGCFSLIAFRL